MPKALRGGSPARSRPPRNDREPFRNLWRRFAARTSHFEIRRVPRRRVHYLVGVELLCLAAISIGFVGLSVRIVDLLTFGTFVLLGRLAIETSRHLGAPGRGKDDSHRDLLATWTLPVVLLLPPVYAAVLYFPLHCFFRTRGSPHPRYRHVFQAAALGVSGFCASSVHLALAPAPGPYRMDTLVGSSGRIGALFAAVLIYTVLNRILLHGARLQPNPGPARRGFGGGVQEMLAVDAAEMCSAIVIAVLWTAQPLLMLAATPPALLLQRSLLHAELLQAARTDAKTRLANPGYWRDVAEREVMRVRRAGRPLSILVVDIDHFKQVNDQFGHLTGDAVLCSVADAMRTATRPRDLVGRFGGEEFVVLLREVDVDIAARTAERIRRQVAATRCRVDGKPGGPVTVSVTVSVGVAAACGADADLASLLETADAALYRAKADGRNRVRVAASLPRDGHQAERRDPGPCGPGEVREPIGEAQVSGSVVHGPQTGAC